MRITPENIGRVLAEEDAKYAHHLELTGEVKHGQGQCPNHADNPHHEVLTWYGWTYSHTTRVRRVDGSYSALHTYRFPGTDNVVGVNCRAGWCAEAGRLGSSRRFAYFGTQLGRYLQRKTRELTRQRA